MDSASEGHSFRGLLLQFRGRTGLIQRELARRAGVSLRSVQDWEGGVTAPTAERLRGLIRALLVAGGLTEGRERSEAHQLWAAAEREAVRSYAPFDDEWFATLLGGQRSVSVAASQQFRSPPESARAGLERAQDWGEAPDTSGFVGRSEETALLHQWIMAERRGLVMLLGIGGIGKTTLAARVAQDVAPNFERVYWRSVRNAPPVSEWLSGTVAFVSDQQLVPSTSETEQLMALLQLLRVRRCLLVLDNVETLLEPSQYEGRYRAGMEGYGRILQALGETSHQSCLLITSREAPPEIATIAAGRTRTLELHGLGVAEAQTLLADKQLDGNSHAWLNLVERYDGNGLALKIVSETIRQVYASDIARFLSAAPVTHSTVFGGIRRLLDTQVQRLSPTERDVLRQLAIAREPITVAELSADLAHHSSSSAVVEALENLRRRSLVERGDRAATFTLQSMVLEYITDRLVETVADGIRSGESSTLVEQPLIKALAKDYVRQTQERLIGQEILTRLEPQQARSGTESLLLGFLDAWRGRPAVAQGYGPGNVVNLLRLLRGDLRGLDLSRLTLRQAYLAEVHAQDASLAGAHLSESVLSEGFDYPSPVAISADGALLASGTSTGELRLWRVADRTLLLSVRAHNGPTWCVALTSNGRLLASGGVDGMVRLWESASGRSLATWNGHTGEVRGLALSDDGRLVATGGVDGLVQLWEAPSGKPLATLQGHAGVVYSVSLRADGQLLASGGGDGTVRLWAAQSGRLLGTLQGHSGLVMGVALSKDGRLLASCGADGTVRLWDPTTCQPLFVLHGHAGLVYGVAFSADGQLLASSGFDATVRLWDPSTGRLLANLLGHTGLVYAVAFSADGRLLTSGSWDGTVRLWEPVSGRPLASLQGQAVSMRGMALSSDGRLVASGGVDGTVRLWETETGRLRGSLTGHRGVVYGVTFSADGELLASGGLDGRVRVWGSENGQMITNLQAHTGMVLGVALSGDGQLLASGGTDSFARVWEPKSGQLVATLQGHAGLVYGVALTRDGRIVASGGVDGTVRLWEPRSGQPLATLLGHSGLIHDLAFSLDGRLLASGGFDGTLRLWDSTTAQLVAALDGHSGAIYSVSLSADGHLAASSGADGTVRLWEVAGRRLLATLYSHTGLVWGVELSQDGRHVVSGGDDGNVRVWDVQTGACLRTLSIDRRYQRVDITGLTGITDAQRSALLALGAFDSSV